MAKAIRHEPEALETAWRKQKKSIPSCVVVIEGTPNQFGWEDSSLLTDPRKKAENFSIYYRQCRLKYRSEQAEFSGRDERSQGVLDGDIVRQ